jgi:phage regulator Rha-like protein
MNELSTNTVRTMSSLEIAELTEKDHFHVMRDIKEILDEAGIGASKFGCSYLSSQNKELP